MNISISLSEKELIKTYRKTSSQLIAAAVNYLRSASYIEIGNHKEAALFSILANKYLGNANKIKRIVKT